ncbi:MAG: type II toxin-antitoxin system VapC family toxin [Leptolyngbyaceae cyanobacterium CSU_1_4]|nr:type II toxin-antitoxin system VapC family toxin [Leptolyngbyaceae cyanobacterium CSU_1_4]
MLNDEPGGASVEPYLMGAGVSSVNWSEVIQKLLAKNVITTGMQEDFQKLGLTILPFTTEQAELAANLWTTTKPLGLSLGDRACLALAIASNLPVVTADKVWKDLNLPIVVQMIR